MRKVLVSALVFVALAAVPAVADDGVCEVDGEAGLSTAWGECMTPSLYDEMYSFENLSTVPSLTSDQSVAAEVGLVPGDVPSERELGAGLVEETQTFVEIVWWNVAGPQ